MKNLRLTIELVPEPLWEFSLANNAKNWDILRKSVYKKANYACEICERGSNELGPDERFEAHELWAYDDKKRIQKLMDLICLCSRCHQVKHMGRTRIKASEGELDINKVIEHFCKVNKCDRQILDKHEKEVFRIWRERSKHTDWKTDLGGYSDSFH